MLRDDDLDLPTDKLTVLYAEHPGLAQGERIHRHDRQVMSAASRALAVTWRDWFAPARSAQARSKTAAMP